MGSNIDLNESPWDLLAAGHEGMVIAVPLVEGQIWCCLVCGFQGMWFCDWDETSTPNPWSLEMDTCCAYKREVVTFNWCAIRQSPAAGLSITLWKKEGDRICSKILFKADWGPHGATEASYFFSWVRESAENGYGFDGIVAASRGQDPSGFH